MNRVSSSPQKINALEKSLKDNLDFVHKLHP